MNDTNEHRREAFPEHSRQRVSRQITLATAT
jgi:hypothetical protein